MARAWRLYQPDLPRTRGAEVELSPREAHHASTVLRLRTGERASVFDGRGEEWSAEVLDVGPGRVRVRLLEPVHGEVEPPIRVSIYQGLCRAERMEWVIQKATELGAAAIHPWTAERAERRKVSAGRLERWKRIAVESCKQSGRRVVPAVELCDTLPPADPPLHRGLLLQPGAGSRAPGADPGERPPGEVSIAVGPEGGLTENEVAMALDSGWEAISLGPRTLRTETAGLVALSLVMHRWGDLRSAPPSGLT